MELYFSIKCLRLCLISVLLISAQVVSSSPVQVDIYEYHKFPPMVVSQEKSIGLSFAFARYLSNASDGKYQFKIHVVSMDSLQLRLKNQQPAVVLFVNPIWFDDPEESKFFWSEEVLTLRDEIVSLNSKPFIFSQNEDYKGKRIGGIKGYTYPVLDALVSDNLAQRVDAQGDLENLKRLYEKGDLDAIIVNEGPLKFYSQLLGIQHKLFVSPKPSGVYQVKIMVTKNQPAVFEFIQSVLANMDQDSAWMEIINLYLP